MRAKIALAWIIIRSSYWFIPTVMSLTAVASAFGFVWIDRQSEGDLFRGYDYLYTSTPDAGRTLLVALASSMITVAGVTFAITISSVGYATAQYGPRILTNFMRDRGNQVSLGAFIANFLYCMFVLRSIQSPVDESDVVTTFIPQLAIIIALAATVGCAAILIYYIHHVPESLHISRILKNIGHDLNTKIESLFPEEIGEGDDAEPHESESEGGIPVFSIATGYIQTLAQDDLMDAAKQLDLIVVVKKRPGDFVSPGTEIAMLRSSEAFDESSIDRVRAAFAVGDRRNPDQDSRFLVNELVEIAARALSPGQNDPYTAIATIDWLTAAVIKRIGRKTPSNERFDEDNRLRVIAPVETSLDMLDSVYDQLRPYSSTDVNTGLAHARSLRVISERDIPESVRERLSIKANELFESTREQDWCQTDRIRLTKQLGELVSG